MSNIELFEAVEQLKNRDLVVDFTNYKNRTELRFIGLSKTKYLLVKLQRFNLNIDVYVMKDIDGIQLLILTEPELNEVLKDLQRAIEHEIKNDWLGNND